MYNNIRIICLLVYIDFVSVEIAVEVNEIALYRCDYYCELSVLFPLINDGPCVFVTCHHDQVYSL